MRTRVIPALLLHKGGLIKSVKFKNYRYVGDPINAVRIFNEKEVDELALIDIDATREGRGPDVQAVAQIVSEAFMPVSYGGGIRQMDEVKALFFNGVEKIILNKTAATGTQLISQVAGQYGSQSVVVSIDVKKNFLGKKKIHTASGTETLGESVIAYSKRMEEAGAGELLLHSIDRDGTYAGYDLDLIAEVAKAVQIPVIASGGASTVDDFVKAKEAGASAVSAGSMFVFQRPHNAVLISYPSQEILKQHKLI
jgi:imidazole glycerol-phosphate synthase subunit HisF